MNHTGMLMLYIHCTAKLAKATRTTLEVLPVPDDLYWLDCWYANVVPLDDGKNLFLFTNAQSLYSIVIPRQTEGAAFFAIVAEFRQRLTDTLILVSDGMEDIVAIAEGHDQYTTCKTESRSVLGTMNDIILFVRDYANQNDDINIDDLETMLNEIPHSPLNDQNPQMRFSEMVDGL